MFQWKEFKDIADDLISNPEEAYLRCAASRYYYSIFCSTREYLVDIMHKYEFDQRNDIHVRVYDELIDSKDPHEVKLANVYCFFEK